MKFVLFLLFLFFCSCFIASTNEEQQLIENYKTSKSTSKRIYHLEQLNNFYSTHDLKKWDEGIEQLKLELKKTTTLEIKNRIHFLLAEHELKHRNIGFYKQHLNYLKNANFNLDFETNHRYNLLQIENYILQRNYELAKSKAFKDLKLVENLRKNRFTSETYALLIRIYANQNKKDSTFICVNKCINYAKRSDLKQTLLEALNKNAFAFAFFENYEGAVNKQLQLLHLAEEDKNLYYQALAFREIANYSLLVGNYDVAFIYLKSSINLSVRLKDERSLACCKLLSARINFETKNYNQSIEEIKKAERFFKFFSDQSNLGKCAHLSALIFSQKKQFIQALNYFQKALKYFENSGDFLLTLEVNKDLGALYLQRNDLKLAEFYLNKTLHGIENQQVNEIKYLSTYKLLSTLYIRKNQAKKALEFELRYSEILEQNSTLKASAAVERMTEQNLREKRERVILYQKEAIKQQQQEQMIFNLKRDRQLYIIIIFAVLVIFGFIFNMLRSRQLELKQKQREMELSQSLLRSQMNPHFIFNAMSVIQSYIYSNEPEKSSQFLVNFSRLMRLILENSPKEFIDMELEAEILEKYLQAQKMRFENRFNYSLEIDDALISSNAMVPPMITQPFVENAIEHGQLHTLVDGKISIKFTAFNGMMKIEIADNGVGRKGAKKTKKAKSHKSMAINITKERIDIINLKFSTKGSVEIEDFDKEKETGTIVTILLPLHNENI